MPRLPSSAAGATPDIGEFREWNESAQERALELLEARQSKPWRPFYCRVPRCNGQPHVRPAKRKKCAGRYGHEWALLGEDWLCEQCGVGGTPVDGWLWRHARHDQRPPRWADDWVTWFLSGGRGSGKTRTGSEVTHRASGVYPRMILIAPTGPDLRETMIEDPDSGLLATAHPDRVPIWEPSKKKLTWPNGCEALGFSAEEPDRLRGKQSGFVWADEPAHFPDPDLCWSMMEFGHRVEGKNKMQPKVCMTSTPIPSTFVKNKIAEPDTITVRVSSYANSSNLAENYKRKVLAKYEGTRMGRQEIEGEILEDVEGALWNWDMYVWNATAPALIRIIVAVDPAGTANRRSDETGIVVLGLGADKVIYVLADWTGKYSPGQWADKAVSAYEFYSADAIVVEVTYGRDMVRSTLENSRVGKSVMPRIISVDSRRGKQIRAEPVVALYEKNRTIENGKVTATHPRIVHVGDRGDLAKLEDEQTTWVPGESDSPNRVDALVHGVTELVGKGGGETTIAVPSVGPTAPISPFDTRPSGLQVPSGIGVPSGNPYGLYIPGGLS